MNCLPILISEGFSPTRQFVEFVRDYHVPLESPTGQAELAVVVQHTSPSLFDLADTIRGIVAVTGAVIIKGLSFERIAAVNGEAVRDALVLALTGAIGEPTDHCADKRVMWPITDRPVPIGTQATFSESLGEAPLHTDSAFTPRPERYNALYVVRQSRCGGGHTVLVDGSRFLADFANTESGGDCIRFMRETDYPFRVPDAFFTGERFITAKILADKPLIRFRYDCIERGFDLCPDLATDAHRFFCALFRDAIEMHASRNTFLMEDGDLIVYDNTRLLHGRTDFRDPLRYLIRVRMHERDRT